MKKIISGVLSAVILTSVLCACNDGGNQSNSSQSGNNADSSQQTVTTEVATTQPATEPNYKETMLHRFHPKIKPISLKKFHSMMRQPQADIRLMIVNSEYIMQVCKVDA